MNRVILFFDGEMYDYYVLFIAFTSFFYNSMNKKDFFTSKIPSLRCSQYSLSVQKIRRLASKNK